MKKKFIFLFHQFVLSQMRKILNRKRLFITIVIISLGLIYLRVKLLAPDEIDLIHAQNLKAVQLITQRFYFPNWGFDRLGRHPFSKCPESRCFAFHTHFWKNKPYEKSDGVIVHVPDLHYMSFRNSYNRNPKQLWLFYTLEPQQYSYCSHYLKINQMDDWFNLTATFKPDSDVQVTYKNIKKLDDVHKYSAYLQVFMKSYSHDPHFLHKQLEKPKTNLALWIVSHCHTFGRREDYINELKKHMNVDVYGWCNSRSVPCDHHKSDKLKNECLKNFFNSYKFYMAFENCKCDHYITEKYWQFYYEGNFFSVNIIPVVMGPPIEHYGEKTFGFKTFIHVDSFDSPKSLADYLLYLDKNNTAYLEYFEWKKEAMKKFKDQMGLVQSNRKIEYMDSPYSIFEAPFCEICSKLHDNEYLNSQNKPPVKITDIFNPIHDCRDKGDPNRLKTFFKNLIGKCV